MKRMIPLVLVLSLLLALLIPSALAENAAVVDTPAQAQESDGASAAPPQTQSAENTVAQESQLAVFSALAPSVVNNSEEPLSFTELRGALLKYNSNVLALQSQMQDLNNTSTDDLWNTIVGLDGQIQNLKTSAAQLDDDNPLKTLLNSQIYTLGIQRASLESQMDSLDDTIDTTKNTLNDGINQAVKGAEALYINLIVLQASVKDVQRNLDAMDRAVAIYEKQEQLGMASAYDVETQKYQRSQLASRLEALNAQIKTLKLSMESLCGKKLTGTIQLQEPVLPTEEELAGINYDKALTQATNRNAAVMSAQIAYDSDNSTLNKRKLQSAVDSFALGFKTVCLAVPEKSRLVDVAQESVDYQQRTFAIAEKKYSLGMISQEEYLAAQSTLDQAKSDLYAAQLNLFSAYRDYVWATQYGVA